MARDDNTGRNLALVAGGGALLWFVLRRGGGFGLGGKGWGRTKAAGSSTSEPVRIRIDQIGISIGGQATDIAGAVAAAKAAGGARVVPTGAARQGTVDDLIEALRAAGVIVWMGGLRAP